MHRTAFAALFAALAACSGASGTGPSLGVDPFLDDLQARSYRYFWDLSNPANGLTPDRAPTPSFSSVAAVGFALTAYPIGVDRGLTPRGDAAARVLTTMRFFWQAPQGTAAAGMTGHQGFFYHFLDMSSGSRFQTVELSTIDTALLLAGVLTCQVYFDGADSVETAIRAYADSLYRRTDWTWAQNNPPAIALGWSPEGGFLPYDWRGYNEAMLLYILALGSPTHPVEPAAWSEFVSRYEWREFQGQQYVAFPPLFGHQYSHVWIDFRGIRDSYMRGRGIDYFENSRRATYAQRAYAIENPSGFAGYGANMWGLSASDGPYDTTITIGGRARTFRTYWARGAAGNGVSDDGTIAPTAAASSLPFAPEIVEPALLAMRDAYGGSLYATYGFVDAFNPTFRAGFAVRQGRVDPRYGWLDTDYLGIDQGPIVAMIANHRSDFVWNLMKRSPYVVTGLRRAGFTGGWLDAAGRASLDRRTRRAEPAFAR